MTSVEYQIMLRDRFSGPMNKAERSLDRFNNELTETNVKATKATRKMRGLGGSFKSMGRMIGITAVIAGVGKIGSSIVRLGADMEQTKVSFGTLLGSAEKATKLVDDINQFANVTPFQNDQLFENAKLLLNFGLAGEKVIPTMTMLGDISGGNANKFQMLSLAYSQARSAGKLMGQDLLQMINAGFNPLQEISRKTGESIGVLKQKMSKGLITVKELDAAFLSATSEGGRFHKMMEKQSKTLTGRWSTFMGKLKMVGIQIGTKLLPVLGRAVEGLMAFMETAKKNFHIIKKAIEPVIHQFKKVFQSIKNLIIQIKGKNKVAKTAAERWQNFGKILKIMMTPLRTLLFVIRKVIDWVRIGVVWFQKMYDKFSGLRKIIKLLMTPFTALIDAFKWLNRQLDQSDKMDKLDAIRQKLDKLRESLSGPITLAKKSGIINQIKELNREATELVKGKRQWSWLAQKGLGGGAGGDGAGDGLGGGAGGLGGAGGAAASPYKITGAAPKVFNLNITKLVENFNINTTNIKDAPDKVKNDILTAMMEAIVDVQTNVK